MKKILSSFILIIVGLLIGYFGQGFINKQLQAVGLVAESASGSGSAEKKILYWVAPMDPNYRRDKPGKSPMGMDLVPVYEEEKPKEKKILYWVAPMDPSYRRDKPGKSPMGMDLVPVYDEGETQQEGVVKISPVVQNNIGVRIAEVIKGSFDRSIRTVGYISLDEDKIWQLHTRVEGWVEKLYVKSSGDKVKKGQKLLELYSPTLVNAQEEYLTALKSKNSYLINASKDRLISLGVTKNQIARLKKTRKVRQLISYYARQSGFLQQLKIREGMYVKPSVNILTIARLDTVWVIAEVFERQSGLVKAGQTVEMTTESYPAKTWLGVVDYIYPVLQKKTRTLRVRIRFNNQDELLKPNMFATLKIKSKFKPDTLFVKREAIIRTGSMERVVKSLGDGKFLSVAVKTGGESDGYVEILKGLKEGEKIVTSAQFLIDSESSLTAAFDRMEEPKAMQDEDKGMDKKDMKTEQQASESAHTWLTGKIVDVMADHHMLTINHDAVPEWDRPAMVMDFMVSDDIDLGNYHKDDAIRFLVEEDEEGALKIISIESQLPDYQAWVKGKVLVVDKKAHQLTLEHQPVDVWGWPAMTMDFPVAKNVKMNVSKGENYQFLVEKYKDGSIAIIQIKQGGKK